MSNEILDHFVSQRAGCMLDPHAADANFAWYGQHAYGDALKHLGEAWPWDKVVEMLQVALEVIDEEP